VPCLSVATSSGRRVSEERRDIAEGVDQRVCQLSRGKHMDVLSLRCCFAKQGAVGTQTLSNSMCEVPHVIHKGSRMVHAKEALELWDDVRMAPDGRRKVPDSRCKGSVIAGAKPPDRRSRRPDSRRKGLG
jgi:hypothetical protein